MATNRLQITELDFLKIKENLKTYLKGQSEFQDYDFDGSGLSILLDILAYNTHYNAYYLNMISNEAFLDTATLRDSVVSHAKTLGYIPHSKRAAKAIVNITATASVSSNSSITLPRGFSFKSEALDSSTYTFCLLEEKTATKVSGKYFFENVPIYQGELVSYSYTYDASSNPKSIFTIEDENVDISTIKVSVQQSFGNTEIEVFSNAQDELDVGSTSAVYFLQETMNRKYQIYFGNGSVGKAINDGAIVNLSYLVTQGDAANKIKTFSAFLYNPSVSDFKITTTSVSSGGSEIQSVDEIKLASTSRYTSQNRLVTVNDYEFYVKNKYPTIDSLSIWGGEEERPKVFGKVYLSLKPKVGYFISEFEKRDIINNIIKPKSIVSIEAEIKDPDYLYLILNANVRYQKNKTTLTTEQVKTLVRNKVLFYNQNYLNKFKASLISSRLQDIIDSADNSIVGNEVKISLLKKFRPSFRTSNTYQIDFGVPLKKGTSSRFLKSTQFAVLDDSGVKRNVILEEVPSSDTGISKIDVVNAGFGYITPPVVTITGDGYGAEAVAVIKNGRVETIEVVKRGYGYSRASITLSGGFNIVTTNVLSEMPSRSNFLNYSLQQKAALFNRLINKGYEESKVRFAFDVLGGKQTEEQWQSIKSVAVEQSNTTTSIATTSTLNTSGTGRISASAIAVIDSKIGDLRTVYFTNKSERRIVNSKAGTVDYPSGRIILRDLNIQNLVDTNQQTINLIAESESGIIESTRNTLLTIDENDPTSIDITIQTV